MFHLRLRACANFCSAVRLPVSHSENLKRVLAEDNDILFDTLTPPKIVEELDKRVIGQESAKHVLAVAFRNRLRRLKVPIELRSSIRPSNILMEGPTGCGKTELCRALAALTDAPFVRVEATKYTEVGYVGKDVTSIGIDLMRESISKTKKKLLKKEKSEIDKIKAVVEQQIVNSMLGTEYRDTQIWLSKLRDVRAGNWDDRKMSILPGTFLPDKHSILTEFDGQVIGSEATIRELIPSLCMVYQRKIKDFFSRAQDAEEEIIKNAQENGIVFIDQIDKIAIPSHATFTAKGVSTEGVQRDFLPLLQGTTVPISHSDKPNKFLRTDNILFVAGGSFARVKVQDLLPQLLGRLPVKVNLTDINQSDLVKILRKQNGLIQQQIQLLKPEGVTLQFNDEAVEQVARIAYQMNLNTENTGARRLATMMDSIMKDYSFNAQEHKGSTILMTRDYVRSKLKSTQWGYKHLKSKMI